MDELLLNSKLYLPLVRPDLVMRPRLLQRLDQGLQRKLTLLSAPAGFGKTTLLANWAAGLTGQVQVSWLSIDPADNDPARFFEYFLAAIGNIIPGLGISTLPTSDLPRPGFEPELTVLINKLGLLPGPLVLILDDYHLIEEPAIHQGIDFLLDHQPASFHLVLATRADPPLHLSRLRGRNQLNEVRLADLRFTTTEAAAFLNQAMGLELTPDQVTSLTSRTEGWIAGLQLAALSLSHQEDPRRFVQNFTGGTHFILDYLTDEVFQSQPFRIQDFLLRTAILDRLSGPLCDAVCQSSPGDSQKVLVYLEHANLFTLPLDDRQEWYRYHQLFADLLRQRLGQDQPGLLPGLYQRASVWCECNALPYEAIEYAFSAGDPERSAGLIEGVSQGLLMQGKAATLLHWLERLPPALLDERLSLAADHAWALLLCCRPFNDIRLRLERLDALSDRLPHTDKASVSSLAARTLPLRSLLAFYRGQPDQALGMAIQALNFLDPGEVYLRAVAALAHALTLFVVEDSQESLLAVRKAAEAGVRTGNVFVAVLALLSLAENERKLGLLRQTRSTLEQALELAVDGSGNRLPIAGRVLVGLGDLYREWNDQDKARQLTLEGLHLLEQSEMVGTFHGYLVLARIEQADGDVPASRRAIQQAWHWARAFDASDLDDQTVAILEARLAILQGDTDIAIRWLGSRGLLNASEASLETQSLDPYTARLRKYELALLARLWLAQNRPRQALSMLEKLFTEFERANRPGMIIEIHLLQALAYRHLGDHGRALDHLEQALQLAEPEGYIRAFLDEDEGILALLRQAASQVTIKRPASTGAYINRLLTAAGGPGKPGRPAAAAANLIEPLSDREIDVLRLLAGSLSAAQIADELVISSNTVHSHVKSIYAKLEVHSRYQAVDRARALKII
jgi:LuxR family maltose regulon positive regulatory protein